MCSRTREINENKVETVMWDTLYVQYMIKLKLYNYVLSSIGETQISSPNEIHPMVMVLFFSHF